MNLEYPMVQAKLDRVYQLAREAQDMIDGIEYDGEGGFSLSVIDFDKLTRLPVRILEALTEVSEEAPSPELYAELVMKEGAGQLTEADRADLQAARDTRR